VVSPSDPGKRSQGSHVYTDALLRLIRMSSPATEIDMLHALPDLSRGSARLRRFAALVRSIFSRYPAKVLYCRTRRLVQELEQCLSQKRYDAVLIDSAVMMWVGDRIPDETSRILVVHNLEASLYGAQVKGLAATPGLGWLFRGDYRKFESLEWDLIRHVDRVITISRDDETEITKANPNVPVRTIPPLFYYSPATPAVSEFKGPVKLGFLGSLSWWPNRRALEWLLDSVLPQVSSKVELHVYGKGSDEFNRPPLVYGHGFVTALSEVWQNVHVMVHPMQEGGGVNVKVAESIYNRMPMIATPQALRGFALETDEAVVVLRDDPALWIDFCNSSSLRELAGRRTSPRNAELFSAQQHANDGGWILKGIAAHGREADRE